MKLLICVVSATVAFSRYVPPAHFDFALNNGEVQKAFGFVQYVLQQQDFYKNVPNEGQAEFLSLVTDMTSPRSQVEASLNAWAEKYGVQNSWKDFSAKIKARLEDVTAAVKEILKQLPGVFDQIIEINADKTLSVQAAFEKFGVVAQPLGGRLMGALQPLLELYFPNGTQEIQGMIPPFGGQQGNQNGFNFNNNINQVQPNGNGQNPQSVIPPFGGQRENHNGFSFNNNQVQTAGNGQNPQGFIFNGQQGAGNQMQWNNNFIPQNNAHVPVVLN